MSLKKVTINGNTLEPTLHGPGRQLSDLDAQDASGTKHILIQTEGPLSPDQKADLKSSGVVIENYISENTYLCEYDPDDLEILRSKEFVNYVNVYLSQLKIHPRLKAPTPATASAEGPTTSKQKVDLLFHEGVDASSASIKVKVAEKAHADPSEIYASGQKVRLEVDTQYLEDIATIDEVFSVEDVRAPQLLNNVARGIINADVNVNATPFRGEGQIVAVADTGFDTGRTNDVHPAFTGRVQRLYALGKSDASDPPRDNRRNLILSGHGTHVCGSVLGDAFSDKLDIRVEGTAPEATLIMQACADEQGQLVGIPPNLEDLFNQVYSNDGVRIHTNSWGTPLPTNNRQGEYDPSSREIDNFIWNHKDMTICFAAGNDGMDADRNGVVDARQIGSQAAAKNCITVGASENFRPDVRTVYSDFGNEFPADPLNQDRIANNAEGMAAFSSRGPTAEDRIKPDVTAPGTQILSARGRLLPPTEIVSDDPLWSFLSGTSMACPLVAGCVAVLRETLVKSGNNNPSAAVIKALLINGAVNMRGQYRAADVGPSPNNINGWGRVNLAGSVIIPQLRDENGGFGEGKELDQGEDSSIIVNIPKSPPKPEPGAVNDKGQILLAPNTPGGATFKITLVWTDPSGAMLQNDLDLIVQAANGEVRHGNMGTGKGFDRTNNVEQVLWHNIPPGEAKITVHCERITRFRQDWAYAWRIG